MVKANVKKIVKKEVKKAERKRHPNAKRKFIKRATNRGANLAFKRAPSKALATLGALASGANAERRAAIELAKRLCCPSAFDAFAVQDGFQSQPVGVSSPYMVMPASFSPTEGSGVDTQGISHADLWIFAYRDVHRALQWYDGSARTYEYNAVNDGGSTTFTYAANQPNDYDAWNYGSGVDVYGSKLYTGVVEDGRGSGSRWTIGQKNEYIKISGLPASTPTSLTVSVLTNDEVFTGTITATSTAGGVGTFNWSAFVPSIVGTVLPSFFHFGNFYVNQIVTAGTVSKGGSAIPVLRQLPLANFQTLNQIVEKLRFNALNVMYSNTAAALSRGGYIAGWQVPSNLDNFNLMLSGFDSLSNRPGAMRIEANEGAHEFWKSTDVQDWEFMDVGDPTDNSSGGGNYVIDSDYDYLALCINQPTVAMRAGYISVFAAVEYRHNSVWFPLVRPAHNRKVFEDALEIQSGLPMLHCNPFHIKDIFNWIGNHKRQIQQTISMGANAVGGIRAQGYANAANDLIDVWFK